MSTVVFISRLQRADGKRDALIGLRREFAHSINADPECLPYSVHEPIDDEATRLTVIQAYESVAGFEEHGEWMEPNIPRLVPVLASPTDPPVLLQSRYRWAAIRKSRYPRSRVLLRAPTASPGSAAPRSDLIGEEYEASQRLEAAAQWRPTDLEVRRVWNSKAAYS